jgi:hypothetical protein
MSPFLDEEDGENVDFDTYPLEPGRSTIDSAGASDDIERITSSFFKDDRRFFIVGGIASVATFLVVAYVMYNNSRPIDMDDLPLIRADISPIKVKPVENNAQISHQDKVVYDNISGDDKRAKVVEKTLPQPEEILSISEMEAGETLSEEEKKNIIQAFDDLAPEKEYKINYVKAGDAKQTAVTKSRNMKIVEDNPPLKIITPDDSPRRNSKKQKLSSQISSLVSHASDARSASQASSARYDARSASQASNPRSASQASNARYDARSASQASNARSASQASNARYDARSAASQASNAYDSRSASQAYDARKEMRNIGNILPERGGSIMVQIASLPTRASAEVEYKRITNRNVFLKNYKTRIVKVDLGKSRGITYRVHIGPFKNSTDAQRIVSTMKSNGCDAYIAR